MYQGGNAMGLIRLNKKSTNVKVLFFALFFVTAFWGEMGFAGNCFDDCTKGKENSYAYCAGVCANSSDCESASKIVNEAQSRAMSSCRARGEDISCYHRYTECTNPPPSEFANSTTANIASQLLLGGISISQMTPDKCVSENRKDMREQIKDLERDIKQAEKDLNEEKKQQVKDKKEYDEDQKKLKTELKDIQKELRESKLKSNEDMASKSKDFAEFQRSVPEKLRQLRTAIEKAKMTITVQQQTIMKVNIAIIKAECTAQAKKKAADYKASIGSNLSKERDEAIKQSFIQCVEAASAQTKANEQKALNEIAENQNSIRDNTEKMQEVQSELVERENAFKQDMELQKKNLTDLEQEAYQKQIDVNKSLVESTKNYIAQAKNSEENIRNMQMKLYQQKLQLSKLQSESKNAVNTSKSAEDFSENFFKDIGTLRNFAASECCTKPENASRYSSLCSDAKKVNPVRQGTR